MKISTTCRAALVAASALAVLAPTQAFAAETPAWTTENIAYLDTQDKQNEAKEDQAKLGKTHQTGAQPAHEPVKKNSIPEDLLTTNPITGAKIKIGGKTFNRLVSAGVLTSA